MISDRAIIISLISELLFSLSLVLCVLACISVCRPILMGEMLGFDNVNNAFGFVLMFYGLASFIGIPLAGTLVVVTV